MPHRLSLMILCSPVFQKVEVGPSSFLKIKMLGKGDVGRVYLVREKKNNKLYAMKGSDLFPFRIAPPLSPNGWRIAVN